MQKNDNEKVETKFDHTIFKEHLKEKFIQLISSVNTPLVHLYTLDQRQKGYLY